MHQAVIRTPTTFEVLDTPRPQLQSAGDLLVRTAACGICSGDLMQWYLQRKVGTVLGHEVVGYAEQVGLELEHIRPGQLVFVHHHAPCLQCRYCRAGDHVHCPTWRAGRLDPGGMAEYIRVPAELARVDCFPIDELQPEVGVFIEPLACSLKALARAMGHGGSEQRELPRLDGTVGAVVGCGVMGLLNLAAARALGTRELWAVEPDPVRAERARSIGADRVFPPDELLARAAQPGFSGADWVIVGPGIPQVVLEAVRYVRSGGRAVLFTPTPDLATTPLDLGELYFREVSLVPSYSCGPRETRWAYELLRTGRVDPWPLVTHRFRLEEIQRAYDTAKAGRDALKVLVVFPLDQFEPGAQATGQSARLDKPAVSPSYENALPDKPAVAPGRDQSEPGAPATGPDARQDQPAAARSVEGHVTSPTARGSRVLPSCEGFTWHEVVRDLYKADTADWRGVTRTSLIGPTYQCEPAAQATGPDARRDRPAVAPGATRPGDPAEPPGPSQPGPPFHVRYFEIEPGGSSSREMHQHEHVIVVLRGRGSVALGEEALPISFHDVVYVAPWEVHQFSNPGGEEPFGFLCIVPADRDRPVPVDGGQTSCER
ncbi:MAG: alcohol dehydrogenase catalytic domain-containing protein [Pirellulales bacterium]